MGGGGVLCEGNWAAILDLPFPPCVALTVQTAAQRASQQDGQTDRRWLEKDKNMPWRMRTHIRTHTHVNADTSFLTLLTPLLHLSNYCWLRLFMVIKKRECVSWKKEAKAFLQLSLTTQRANTAPQVALCSVSKIWGIKVPLNKHCCWYGRNWKHVVVNLQFNSTGCTRSLSPRLTLCSYNYTYSHIQYCVLHTIWKIKLPALFPNYFLRWLIMAAWFRCTSSRVSGTY